jgi:glycosyltransferase involved in cell wall biosynthesis
MEALAMGVPAITSDSRGCRDVVRDGIDGLVLPEPTAPAMTAAMARLAADPELRRNLGAAALAGRERFSRAAYHREQIGIYTARLGRDAQGAATFPT